MKKYLAEFLGTFFLVFVGCAAVVVNDQTMALTHMGVAFSWGAIVLVLIYTLGDVSGAHFNPAVTVSFFIAKRFPLKEVFPYLGAQLLGAIAGGFVLKVLFPNNLTLGGTFPSGSVNQTFVLEFILTFLLMYVIMNVSTGAKEKGITAGIAIGTTVGMEAMFAGPITGASMNPFRSLGPALVSGNLEHVWIYLVATTLGAICAVFVADFVRKEK